MDFENIAYLKYGTYRQRQAYTTLNNYKILLKLKKFDPILVGTIPLTIDIATSDLDIICLFTSSKEFVETVENNFGSEHNFTIREVIINGNFCIVANFVTQDFEIELFGQNIPTKQQLAYRHLIIEYDLLQQYGEKLRQRIINLKNQGFKTEAAFALELNLTGDPYTSLLELERNE